MEKRVYNSNCFECIHGSVCMFRANYIESCAALQNYVNGDILETPKFNGIDVNIKVTCNRFESKNDITFR